MRRTVEVINRAADYTDPNEYKEEKEGAGLAEQRYQRHPRNQWLKFSRTSSGCLLSAVGFLLGMKAGTF